MKKAVTARVGDSALSEIKLKAFMSWEAVMNFSRRRRGEARGHQILLHTADVGLLVPLLLEGTTIDFLFSNDMQKGTTFGDSLDAINSKNFIRSLARPMQMKVVEFYKAVYNSLVNYYQKVEAFGEFCECFLTLCSKSAFEKEVNFAFDELYRELYNTDDSSPVDQI